MKVVANSITMLVGQPIRSNRSVEQPMNFISETDRSTAAAEFR